MGAALRGGMEDGSGSRATRRGFLTAVAGAAALAGCAGYQGSSTDATPTDADAASARSPETAVSERAGEPSQFTRVYREVSPAVTTIRVTTPTGGGQGSGAVIDDRHVVTNQHVVAGATHVSVVYPDGEYALADVRGADPYSDLAVLELDHPGDPPALTFATEDPAVGTEVVAVGTPFGVGESASHGIVSGVNRSIPGPNNFAIPDAIQTDAPANPGNSGGPLVAVDGTPLGLVNFVRGNDITFAVSGALMNRVVPSLVEDGTYDHSFVGIALFGVTPALAEANGLDTARGVYVDEVLDGGPASGVFEGSDGEATALGRPVPTGGDVILAVDGTRMRDPDAFASYLALHTRPGETVTFTILRDGRRRTVEVTLGERPEV